MSHPPSLFKGIGQVSIITTQAQEIIAFYRDTMGLPLQFEAGGMTFMQAGATSLMVAATTEPVDGDVFLYFEPTDWNAAEAKMEAAGVTFEHEAQVVQSEPTREHMLRPFRDPEGRRLYILGWRPIAAG
jgi:catechol 2,3-dioxygenase-like lactoylglutathione lyase family enzyme